MSPVTDFTHNHTFDMICSITQTGRRPVLDNHRPSGAISLQRVERVRAAAGPLPHDIFSYLRDPVRGLHDITKIVDDMRTGPSGSISIDWSSPVPFDKLLLLKPMGKPRASLTRDDSYAVDFKPTTVSSIVNFGRMSEFHITRPPSKPS